MQRPTGTIRFVLIIVGLVVLVAAIWFIDNKLSNQQDENNLYPPVDYYAYQPTKQGTIACTDPKTGSVLMGIADIYDLPTKTAKEYVLVISNAIIKIEDVTKPTEEKEQLVRALQPHALFHFKYLSSDKTHVSTYLRKNSTWYDTFKFWTPRFDKEWQLLEEKVYDDKNVDGAGTVLLEKIYKMNCLLLIA